MDIFWKRTVSAEFRASGKKFCGNCVFLKNVQSRKLGEISVFWTVLPVLFYIGKQLTHFGKTEIFGDLRFHSDQLKAPSYKLTLKLIH